MSDDPATWFSVEDSRVEYAGFSTVRTDVVSMPDGSRSEREVVEHLDAVAVVPLLADGTVVLLRQYRHPVGGYLLEVPAGILDVDGEEEVEAARRELAEETGLQAGRLEHLTSFHNSAGWSDERTHVYVARDASDGDRPEGFAPEAEEADMEVVRLPLDEAVAAVRAGEITDAKTVVGLLLVAGA